ncbi:hypothetical protein I4U23_000284 [Adineta vaga]|nr:hypothetical protein I4U23_000284 [Adineta vaga]
MEQVNEQQFLGQFAVDKYILEEPNITYSSSACSSSYKTINMINIDDFIQQSIKVIDNLETYIEAIQPNAQAGVNP